MAGEHPHRLESKVAHGHLVSAVILVLPTVFCAIPVVPQNRGEDGKNEAKSLVSKPAWTFDLFVLLYVVFMWERTIEGN